MAVLIGLQSCKQEAKKEESPILSEEFAAVLDSYYEDGLKLNPINATAAGDHRYDDIFTNPLSDEHAAKARAHYENYKAQLANFPDESLTNSEQMSKAILAWECDINLNEFNHNANLTPIDQMWSPNLFMGQLASGSSAQPFNTVEDYEKWMKRVDGFLAWLSSAEDKMREGMEKGHVLPKSLIKKVLPQLESQTTKDLENHLFYSPIKNFPDEFSEEDKAKLTKVLSRHDQQQNYSYLRKAPCLYGQ